jgi:hypothetical protein
MYPLELKSLNRILIGRYKMEGADDGNKFAKSAMADCTKRQKPYFLGSNLVLYEGFLRPRRRGRWRIKREMPFLRSLSNATRRKTRKTTASFHFTSGADNNSGIISFAIVIAHEAVFIRNLSIQRKRRAH